MKPEFKVGDRVTFNAYDNRLPATVKSVQVGMFATGKFMGTGFKDNRVFYELSGDGVTSKCSGLVILESKYFGFINTLHDAALDNLNGEWQRPRELSDRPEVIRDLVDYGLLECKRVDSICYYR